MVENESLVRNPTQPRFWQGFIDYTIAWDDLGKCKSWSISLFYNYWYLRWDKEKIMYAPIFGRLQLWMLTKWQNIYVDVYRVNLFLAFFLFWNFRFEELGRHFCLKTNYTYGYLRVFSTRLYFQIWDFNVALYKNITSFSLEFGNDLPKMQQVILE